LRGANIWEFSVWGANVLAPLSGSGRYGTYNPVYGGEGGWPLADCSV